MIDVQDQIRHTARELLERECPPAHVRSLIKDDKGYSPQLWRLLADVGWLGMMTPEEHGGSGLGFAELAVVLDEAGRALLPGPFLATTVLGAAPLLLAASDELCSRMLPGIARGDLILSGAYFEPDSWFDWRATAARATVAGDGFVLSGTKFPVPYANVADHVVTTARADDGSLGLFLVDPKAEGATVTVVETLDWQRACELSLDDVAVQAPLVLKPSQAEDAIDKTVRHATVATALLAVGGAAKALEIANEYAKSRVAFGRPIGAFQAIKHKLADMLMDVEAARALTYKAVRAVVEETPDEAEAVSAAKAWCNDAYRRVTNEALQIHGGIGFTWEHDMHLFMRKAQALAFSFGDSDFHREVVAQRKFEPTANP